MRRWGLGWIKTWNGIGGRDSKQEDFTRGGKEGDAFGVGFERHGMVGGMGGEHGFA